MHAGVIAAAEHPERIPVAVVAHEIVNRAADLAAVLVARKRAFPPSVELLAG